MSLDTFSTIIIGIELSKNIFSIGKKVFNEFRNFLHNNHKYQITEKHLFNEKEETKSRPRKMTPHVWKLEYN